MVTSSRDRGASRLEQQPASSRLDGIDLARAVAIGGMMLTHLVRSYRPREPQWLQALDNVEYGRSGPLFCVLLGVGAGLLMGRGTPGRVLVARGAVLFVLGLLWWPYTSSVLLILPHLGLLLASAPLWRRLPSRWLVAVAGLAFLTPSTVIAFTGPHRIRAGTQPHSYGDLLDPGELVRGLVWTGGYPIVGWLGFLLIGLWLARQPLQARGTQLRLLLVGVVVMLTEPVLAIAHRSAERPPARFGAAEGAAAFLDTTPHGNRAAWYVLATASSVVVLALCLVVAAQRPVWTVPFVRIGQLALTAYLGHIVLGAELLWPWYDRTRPSQVLQLAFVVAVFLGFAAAATIYRARLRRGPVEALMRAIAERVAGRRRAGSQPAAAG